MTCEVCGGPGVHVNRWDGGAETLCDACKKKTVYAQRGGHWDQMCAGTPVPGVRVVHVEVL